MAKNHDSLEQCDWQRIAKEICQDFSRWAPQLAHAPRPGEVLHGGYNNFVQTIESPSQRWVLRIGNANTQTPAAHHREVAIQRDAAASHLAPTIVFSDSSKRLCLMHYVATTQTREVSLEMLAALFQKIHALPARGESKSSPKVFQHYKNRIPQGTGLVKLLETGAARVAAATDSIDSDGGIKHTLCHNDLLRANRLLAEDGKLYALDWEYAGIGDPFFDLAVCASELPSHAREELLSLYLRRHPTMLEQQRYEAQILMYRCIEACWFSIYSRRSPQARHSTERLARALDSKANR